MDEGYGYGTAQGEDILSKLRAERFRHLEGQVYLDHAGATIYGSHQVEQHATLLKQNLFGNPHSSSAVSSQRTTEEIDSARRDVAAFFHASLEEYDVVFTSGATAGLKLVGESFPFTRQSSFAYSVNAHNSVLGIRSFANARGATMFALPVELLDAVGQAATQSIHQDETNNEKDVYNLVAFPGECNFSGAKHPLSTIEALHRNVLNRIPLEKCQVPSKQPVHHPQGKWLVLLDAAKLAGTNPIDLSEFKPDFMVVSFYKLFGYPSGVGALFIKKSIARHLIKPFHGGGTLATSFSALNISRPHAATHRRFEDGTIPYLSILACKTGLDTLRELTMESIQRHVGALSTYTYKALSTLRHANGTRVCEIYGSHHVRSKQEAGSIVACNFKRHDGSYVGYTEFSALASLHGIHIRTGCFCNPGACQFYLGLTTMDLLSHVNQGHVCGDAMDVIHDRPTGAIRVSFGYMTTKQDVDAFLAFVVQYYVSALPTTTVMEAPPMRIESTTIRLSKITLFPIKSCGGMSVSGWAVGPDGLFYDREWALVDPETLKTFSQKDLPKMATLRPVVDLEAQALNITMSDSTPVSPLSIPLTYVPSLTTNVSVCAADCQGKKYDDLVNAWFTNVLGRPCALVRVSKESRRSRLTPSKAQHAIGFANEAPFLLISRASVTLMNSKFGSDVDEDVFRANFIVDGCDAHAEDRWSEVAIGSHSLAVLGPCGRCTMVNINQTTGESEAGPLKHLASYRRDRGKIYFGQFLALKASDSFRIQVGDTIAPFVKPHETSE
ncbi:hypothetical protein H310_01147 [Aphanomyces invadans]|uniref:Molybdenum cofactor sulfurase n=1 Tax=Aphanomyces invadans TaxID=157072 RepID=A0A024USG2_9STRA|nr:hypothetical protein H310_01147 [Aphanomyces invadans]ETW08603.1 hypothetical protein H310_01147 [Aphanomyces invadans]|eukprot:XP_008862408.1 hypothetical protein H310_01147 [Aphanomyces invadans]